MAVHKKTASAEKTPAFTKVSADKEAQGDKKLDQQKPVVVSDTVTETIVIEQAVSQAASSEMPAESPAENPLTDFKEKMAEEELLVTDDSQKKNYMWPILLIFAMVILLLVGVFLYKYGINIKDKVNVTTPVPSPTAAPQPTKAVDLIKYEIEIQNGSGVSGEASKQESSLKEEGFTISSIGNADNSDYTQTVIKAKAEVDKDFIAKLKSVLSNSFTVGEAEILPDDSSSSVVVIIGTKK